MWGYLSKSRSKRSKPSHYTFWLIISQPDQKVHNIKFYTIRFRVLKISDKVWINNFPWFRNYSVSCKAGFLRFFHTFLRITQEPLNSFKIWLFQMKERFKTYQNKCKFHLKTNCIRFKHDRLGQIDRFWPDFFLKTGPGQAKNGWLKQFRHEYYFSTKKKKLFVSFFTSHK